jgi:predicted anti-sigma-YlaC factor YlaD
VRCQHVTDRLAEYDLDALQEHERAAIAEHLQACAACRAELQALRRTAALLEPLQAQAPPRDLWPAVRRRMTPRRAGLWQALAIRWRPALAAAAALLAVFGVWLTLRGPVVQPSADVLASDLQEQQIMAQWSQPLADDAALGIMLVGLENGGGTLR